MAKKIQLQDANGNVLHPLTLGECVAMNNGENLDTLMSKSQMFTPTITQDKSMFKVGTGVDVDYSANVKDGAYESLVFKGKSLINLLTKTIDTTWNLNLESWSIVSTVPSDYVLKPSTTYSVIVYVTEKTCPDRDDLFWVGDVDGKKDKVTHDIVRKNVSLGANVFVINTVPDFSSVTSAYRGGINFQGSKFVEGTLKWKAIVLEGDWTNKELPPYFTGICDSKMPILRNVGKNLLCTQDYSPKGTITNVEVTQNTLKATAEGVWHGFEYILQLKPNTEYTFSFERDSDTTRGYIRHPENKGWTGGYGGSSNYTFTTRSTGVIRFTIESSLANNTIVVRNPMIIEGSLRPISYENHKTNILRTSEEIVLREVGGVCDTYNPLTGEYTKRIGEFILNGSDNETWGNHEVKGDNVKFAYCPTLVAQGTYQFVECLCDKWKADSQANETIQEQISLYNHMPNNTPQTEVRITVSPTRLQSVDVTGFRVWLSQNPLTVQYILAEPVTTIIKPSTMTPFAYQNGHVVVESGFEGQSLLPEIEYSVVTGRTGQVTQNTKVLRQQEQQIIGLEELLLTQVVQMEYERTLLQFDYELQMMMLG